jgi:hypothetical protein
VSVADFPQHAEGKLAKAGSRVSRRSRSAGRPFTPILGPGFTSCLATCTSPFCATARHQGGGKNSKAIRVYLMFFIDAPRVKPTLVANDRADDESRSNDD